MKKYEQRSSPVASADPCRQAILVGMYEVEPNDGSSYRHFYLASDVDARIAEMEKALRDIVNTDESDDTYPTTNAQIQMATIARNALGLPS